MLTCLVVTYCLQSEKLVENFILYTEIERTTRRNNTKRRLSKQLDKDRQPQEVSSTSFKFYKVKLSKWVP